MNFTDSLAGAVEQVDNRTLYEKYGGSASRNVVAFIKTVKAPAGDFQITECAGSESTVSAATIPVKHPATYTYFASATGSKFYVSYGTVGKTVSGWDEIT